jgi:hypothetical protein
MPEGAACHAERVVIPSALSFRAERGIAVVPKVGPLYRDDCDSSPPALAGLRSE